jgi:F0F1-type ATP synthase assembly protein I
MVKTADKVAKTSSQSSIFISMALDMSWRLAVAVLVPMVGGYELDQKLNSTPAFTITGFVLAMAGFGLVLWRTFVAANAATGDKS